MVGERAEDDVDWNDPWMDEGIGPLQAGGLYTFAARKGTGKSFSLLRQGLLLADAGTSVLYVSLEDPVREIGRRVNGAPFPSKVKDRVKLFVPDRPRMSEVRKALESSGARVWEIDYLQVLQDDTGVSAFNRADQIRNIISELKALARKHQASVILAAQLKRPFELQPQDEPSEEFGDGKEPQEKRGSIFNIRDSSDVENQSEAVILIHRLGRLKFDQTIGAVKSRAGGDRRVFERGPGGWPTEKSKAKDLTKTGGSGYDTSNPFEGWE